MLLLLPIAAEKSAITKDVFNVQERFSLLFIYLPIVRPVEKIEISERYIFMLNDSRGGEIIM
jgi:hypothetical protein